MDISWIIGLIVPGILYYLLARNGAPARAATSGGHDMHDTARRRHRRSTMDLHLKPGQLTLSDLRQVTTSRSA